MADHGYEGGRLNLPFVGHSTFAKAPPVANWDAIDADIAVMGAPFDFGTQYRAVGAAVGFRCVQRHDRNNRPVGRATIGRRSIRLSRSEMNAAMLT